MYTKKRGEKRGGTNGKKRVAAKTGAYCLPAELFFAILLRRATLLLLPVTKKQSAGAGDPNNRFGSG